MCFAGGQIKSTPSIAWRTLCFNPRPPCGGRRRTVGRKSGGAEHFNPRPPCGGRQATIGCSFVWWYFNPRPPCGGRPGHRLWSRQKDSFQSTSSVWRTTCKINQALIAKLISIHVLRVEDDYFCRPIHQHFHNFNPRPPCGGRRNRHAVPALDGAFQSTSSVWRTTVSILGM